MKGIKVYKPPERAAPVAQFIDSLDPRLREKLIRQLVTLPNTPRSALREPHFKHFTLERYRDFYELRERGKVLVRVIFTILPNGEILLLHAFIKRQSRDTMQALEQTLCILAHARDRPELAVEYIVKENNTVDKRQSHTETVTVETKKKDLDVILAQLAPTMEYDDGTWSGTLALDHTSINTQAAGYTTGSSTVTATKTIGPLDRNDMSYIPATMVKNGVTLNLSSVEWQIIGTDLVGDVMVPCSYQAVATYTGKSQYNVATGYVTTANYVGEVTHERVDSVTYRVTYLGTEHAPAEPDSDSTGDIKSLIHRIVSAPDFLRNAVSALGVITVVVLTVLLILSRREVKSMWVADTESEKNQEETDT